ncbi:MAG: hypothetical protein APF80_04205 [Alphaproteobacteria bacterium BRH_c36]|nr:MAG: hypothetical protein APF80_04205 [Alphaproteobacteria bacterium BRH_c36]
MSLFWVSPLFVFIGLLTTRRLSALPASLIALAIAGFIVLTAGPREMSPAELAMTVGAGIWIAVPAVVVIMAGLFFTEVTAPAASVAAPDAPADRARRLGTACFFTGPFVETAAGFGIGFVVAIRSIQALKLPLATTLALAAFSQCLVPWGALGIGTRISSAIVHAPMDQVVWRVAAVMAPALVLMAPIFWACARRAGIAFSRAQMAEDVLLLAAMAALLIAASASVPIELAGMGAIGPVLLVRLWRQHGTELMTREKLLKALPYLALIAALAATRLNPAMEHFLTEPAFTPGHGAPAFSPFLSPAIPLVLVAMLTHWLTSSRRHSLGDVAATTFAKGWRACTLTMLLVALAWILVRSGIAEAVAGDMRALLGPLSPATVPLLGALGGYLTGNNAGAGSLSMPIAGAFAAPGAALVWLAAASIMVGSLLTALSPVRMAMGQALTGATHDQTATAVRLLLPYAALGLAIAITTALLAT